MLSTCLRPSDSDIVSLPQFIRDWFQTKMGPKNDITCGWLRTATYFLAALKATGKRGFRATPSFLSRREGHGRVWNRSGHMSLSPFLFATTSWNSTWRIVWSPDGSGNLILRKIRRKRECNGKKSWRLLANQRQQRKEMADILSISSSFLHHLSFSSYLRRNTKYVGKRKTWRVRAAKLPAGVSDWYPSN